jgi:hypothetical protein
VIMIQTYEPVTLTGGDRAKDNICRTPAAFNTDRRGCVALTIQPDP